MHHESRKTGLLRLRHLMEKSEATAETMDLHRERFERLKDPASAPRAVSSFNLFQTPEDLANRLVRLARLDGRILEPSAGLGRLYRAIRHHVETPVVLVEISPDCCRELYRETAGDDAAELVQGDFLTMGADRLGTFTGIVMNPPFKRGADLQHIRHALTLLEPGGCLVSLCAAGSRQHTFCDDLGAVWHELPAGSFRSEGTNVNAAIVEFHA